VGINHHKNKKYCGNLPEITGNNYCKCGHLWPRNISIAVIFPVGRSFWLYITFYAIDKKLPGIPGFPAGLLQ
jgi:hypothetical protein